ncbi:bifunctional UDP-N-acetylglucosamine diphosphorylase/glucosamine-1-phosphate N-acetyltransferase GlmU [Alkalicaulis satelles]|uniref:Bifunctional protein GlmU n=1 Tax=Alkalicaulis satelles TaxID=2609175 RepID=A0A5M6ZBB7_9PROT|nr:bifunctional UDP-N-acetylglucosamine diphosphorylase/glucosamine-1-phosphate N-acetyltransferase GlmU [Alkalicaulis satelles]KAA5801077.1 bifunctional UDP-N-acetylglucosamine diphosphorylase/glucosamine-1-phosphate N-acetyltransferase GlmU [Alkalicaulis satelles]
MTRRPRAAVILAAGQGTRMKSALAKPLHAVGGRAMLDWSLDLARAAGAERVVTIWGAHSPAVRERAEAAGALTALQDPPLGTGHAVQQAQEALEGFEGDVVVLYADTPLIRAETVEAVFAALDDAAVAVLGFEPDAPGGYGRLIESAPGVLDAIVEAKDASDAQRAVRLCNSGVMACWSETLWGWLSRLTNDNAKGEYYLTDIVALARGDGLQARTVRADASEVLGVNDRADLAAAEAAFQTRRRAEAMAAGVTLTAPETVWFSHDTQIAADVEIEPHVVFGPGVTIASGARIRAFSHLEGARVGEACEVGPYARLRPGAVLETGAKIGNFVEVKKSRLGAGAKANHLAYIGDSDVGAKANIGAGTITCNYDGYFKHRTVIGEGAFIGSNSSLVAPVTIGRGAMTGSGAVITSDVPDDALGLARARQETKPGWAARFRAAMSAKKSKATE